MKPECQGSSNISWVMICDRVWWGFWAKLEIKLAFLCRMAVEIPQRNKKKRKKENPKMPEKDEFYQSLRPSMV